MFNPSVICYNFQNISVQGNKIFVSETLIDVLEFLKNTSEYDFDMLTSIIAVDNKTNVQLIYQLFSTKSNDTCEVYYDVVNNEVSSVVSLYKSAHFDECEIYDLFGVKFVGNEKLKRLFMPETWIGHPLLKSYELNDERLVWNDWYYET